MNTVERVKAICKERRIPISRLEKDLGFSNGYIGQLKKGVLPDNRLRQIAEYLNVSIAFLSIGSNTNEVNGTLNSRDRRDIANDLNRIMHEIRNGDEGPLCYNGIELDSKSLILLENAIEYALEEAKKENKVRFNPNKNKK